MSKGLKGTYLKITLGLITFFVSYPAFAKNEIPKNVIPVKKDVTYQPLKNNVTTQAPSAQKIPATSGSSSNQTSSSNLINLEIARLCQQPGGCRFLIPTQEDVTLVHDKQTCSDCGYILEIFDYAVRYGYLPKEALILAALDPKNQILADALKAIPATVSPDLAARLSSHVDPRQALPTGQNPATLAAGPTLTIGVGPDGQPEIQGGMANRGTQIKDALRSNFLLGFADSTGNSEPTDLSSLPKLKNPFVKSEDSGPTVVRFSESLGPDGKPTESETVINLGDGREEVVTTKGTTSSTVTQAKEIGFFSRLSAAIGNLILGPSDPKVIRDEDPNANPITPTSNAGLIGLHAPMTVQQAFQLLHPGLTGDGDSQTTSSGSAHSSVKTTETPDQNQKLAVDVSQLKIPTDVNSAAALRLGNVTMPTEGGSSGTVSGQVDVSALKNPCDAPGSIQCDR